eukprot:1179889-Ditylum_brightwellii.AAC.1
MNQSDVAHIFASLGTSHSPANINQSDYSNNEDAHTMQVDSDPQRILDVCNEVEEGVEVEEEDVVSLEDSFRGKLLLCKILPQYHVPLQLQLIWHL